MSNLFNIYTMDLALKKIHIMEMSQHLSLNERKHLLALVKKENALVEVLDGTYIKLDELSEQNINQIYAYLEDSQKNSNFELP